jgi:hypothetical protein
MSAFFRVVFSRVGKRLVTGQFPNQEVLPNVYKMFIVLESVLHRNGPYSLYKNR